MAKINLTTLKNDVHLNSGNRKLTRKTMVFTQKDAVRLLSAMADLRVRRALEVADIELCEKVLAAYPELEEGFYFLHSSQDCN